MRRTTTGSYAGLAPPTSARRTGSSAALESFDNSGTPMDPGPDLEPYPWTERQQVILEAFARATRDMADARRTWDGMRREWRGR